MFLFHSNTYSVNLIKFGSSSLLPGMSCNRIQQLFNKRKKLNSSTADERNATQRCHITIQLPVSFFIH